MKYIPVIGLEIHCELNTKSKIFVNSKNSYDEAPNVNVVAGDLAFPGILPVLNKEAVNKAIKMAICLNCEIAKELLFDRKNYFYPDLVKGYQITQNTNPVGVNGIFKIVLPEGEKDVLIHDIHIEEDTASLTHLDDISLINYNRSGVPLIEIVTKPCFKNADEVISFLEQLQSVLKYADVSDADAKKGQIRCDVNISLKKENAKELGTRVEVKNINTFINVRNAIEFEIERQSKLLDTDPSGLIGETRRFSEETGETIHMRKKDEEVDYKYFIEANIPRILIKQEDVDKLKKEIPLLPYERRKLYIKEYDLSEYDADILIKNKDISDYYHECIKLLMDPKITSNYLTSVILGYLNKELMSIKDIYLTPQMLSMIYEKQMDNTISSKQAKELILSTIIDKVSPEAKLNDKNITQISDEGILDDIINKILSENEANIKLYHEGRTNIFDFFVGQVMKETKGKANPVLTKEILNAKLNKTS